MTSSSRSRRAFLTSSALAAVALNTRFSAAEAVPGLKGRVNHSACRWCYGKIPLDDLCAAGKEMGLTSIDLVPPGDFATLQKYGLTCAMVSNPTAPAPDGGKPLGSIERAWNRVEHHDKLVEVYEPRINEAADGGMKHVICFSGNRAGLDDADGIKNCATGLKRLMSLCEKRGITLVMELLNSRVNHKDYQCDHTDWGVALCKEIGSERFKLLYDIYHMQIMEGDVIAHIRGAAPFIAHYHTGGVPGRNEIDETQELNYGAIVKAILATGYKGHVAQEFIPSRPEPLASLKQAVGICDV